MAFEFATRLACEQQPCRGLPWADQWMFGMGEIFRYDTGLRKGSGGTANANCTPRHPATEFCRSQADPEPGDGIRRLKAPRGCLPLQSWA